MRAFYQLSDPDELRHYADKVYLYGQPKWANQFGLAEWAEDMVELESIVCPIDPGHQRAGKRLSDLTIVLPSPEVGDFVWTWLSDCLITDRVLWLFRQAGLTGFEVRPVVVEKVKRLDKRRLEEIPTLWELVVTGKGGDARPESGIRVIHRCEACGLVKYSSYQNGILVDEAQWDGSDFFTVNGYPKHILVTERVKDLIVTHRLTNCVLIPAEALRWPDMPRPEDSYLKRSAMAKRDLASLLVDLDTSDERKWMETAFALGEKGDPAAVDWLLKGFSRRGPIIPGSSALAIAQIAARADQNVREEIFTKISRLLSHSDPAVRATAVETLGRMGGERAGEEVMKLLQDPEEVVRQKAVFVIGLLGYRPAEEAIKGLMRDRSRVVRETAKRVLRKLASRKSDGVA